MYNTHTHKHTQTRTYSTGTQPYIQILHMPDLNYDWEIKNTLENFSLKFIQYATLPLTINIPHSGHFAVIFHVMI